MSTSVPSERCSGAVTPSPVNLVQARPNRERGHAADHGELEERLRERGQRLLGGEDALRALERVEAGELRADRLSGEDAAGLREAAEQRDGHDQQHQRQQQQHGAQDQVRPEHRAQLGGERVAVEVREAVAQQRLQTGPERAAAEAEGGEGSQQHQRGVHLAAVGHLAPPARVLETLPRRLLGAGSCHLRPQEPVDLRQRLTEDPAHERRHERHRGGEHQHAHADLEREADDEDVHLRHRARHQAHRQVRQH